MIGREKGGDTESETKRRQGTIARQSGIRSNTRTQKEGKEVRLSELEKGNGADRHEGC